MAKMKAPKSVAEQFADLDDPAPKEFDPEDAAEDVENDDTSSSASDDGDLDESREHYIDVGKSNLRKSDRVDLGPQYQGSSISRKELLEDDSGDDPFGSHSEREVDGSLGYADPEDEIGEGGQDGDEEIDTDEAFESRDKEEYGGYAFGGGKATSQDQGGKTLEVNEVGDQGDGDVDDGVASCADDFNGAGTASEQQDDDDAADSGSGATSISDESDPPNEPKAVDRAALRKMMSEEQKTVAASLSKAAKSDIAKGRAIQHQRANFDALLSTRIKLQKALIATNSMAASTSPSTDHAEAIHAAEIAALNLWNTIATLRSSLQPANPRKRPFSATIDTPSSALWSEMQSHEISSLPNRRGNLTKWSQRTNPITALPRANKFSQTPTQLPLTSVLDQHLSGSNAEKLVQRTRVPRSCAPIQAAARTTSDSNIYDDADFYTLLLRELVDQRMADSKAPLPNFTANTLLSVPNQTDLKIRKPVDRKASKGRKIRYTVHEKLQNFMAPDDRGSWSERQRAELFSSLLGRKVPLGEEDGVETEEDGEVDGDKMDGVQGEGSLRLFG